MKVFKFDLQGASENNMKNKIDNLIKKLISSGTTISTMESCTSGLIASMITDTEGASAIFPGGYVTYLNQTKIFVGVDEGIINKYGVYSNECAKAMAQTVKEKLNTDIAIGITGTTGNVEKLEILITKTSHTNKVRIPF